MSSASRRHCAARCTRPAVSRASSSAPAPSVVVAAEAAVGEGDGFVGRPGRLLAVAEKEQQAQIVGASLLAALGAAAYYVQTTSTCLPT